MISAFNKILIPVDFTINTEIAVSRAIGLIEQENGEIRLLHVTKPKKSPSAKFVIWDAEKKLMQWARSIMDTMKGVNVNFIVLSGSSVSQMIIESALRMGPDLIVVGKQARMRRWPFSQSVSPDLIARDSNCPVLTAKAGSMNSRTKIIVVPVRDFVPERKLELAILIAKKCKAKVHLLVINENFKTDEREQSQTFLRSYHHLREKLLHPVEYYSISGRNTARAAMDYAKSVTADMILLNPETESGIPGLTGSRHISDLIGNNSKIQVMDIQPY